MLATTDIQTSSALTQDMLPFQGQVPLVSKTPFTTADTHTGRTGWGGAGTGTGRGGGEEGATHATAATAAVEAAARVEVGVRLGPVGGRTSSVPRTGRGLCHPDPVAPGVAVGAGIGVTVRGVKERN